MLTRGSLRLSFPHDAQKTVRFARGFVFERTSWQGHLSIGLLLTGLGLAFAVGIPGESRSGLTGATQAAHSGATPMPLGDVRHWLCQTRGLTELGAVDALAESRYDMLVLDPTRTDWSSQETRVFDTRGMVQRLQNSPASDGRHRKLVLAYLNVGYAEARRWYWTWSQGLREGGRRPEDWPGYVQVNDNSMRAQYPVAYWDERWKDIIVYGRYQTSALYGDYQSALDEILKDGFDGVYLSGVLVSQNEVIRALARERGKDPFVEILSFVREIAAYGAAQDSRFLIVEEGGAVLTEGHPEHLGLLDGIAHESVWFDGAPAAAWDDGHGHDLAKEPDAVLSDTKRLDSLVHLGMPVFNLEYALVNATEAYVKSYGRGYAPYVTRRALSRMTTTPSTRLTGSSPVPSALGLALSSGPPREASLAQSVATTAIYVDGRLTADCTRGNYSVSTRNCSGSDGSAYRMIAAGIGTLESGATLYIRGGTYAENGSTVPALGSFDSMTTIAAYPGEPVTWRNNDIYRDTLPLAPEANNITIRGIDFKGKRYVASNERRWARWQGNVWRTVEGTNPPGEVIEVKSSCNATTLKCAKTVRSYEGHEKSSPENLRATGTDGDFFQDHAKDGVLYVFSAAGDPALRSDLWETGWGITIGNSSSGTGYVIVDSSNFDGQGHAHLKGGYRWWVTRCMFTNVGTDWNDHHIYAWSNLGEGQEAIYEYNYFETDGGMGAAIHVYGYGNQVASEPPDYHIFRYNLIKGTGFWGVLLDGSHSSVLNNSMHLEGNGNRGINLQGYQSSFNVIRNNIISRPAYVSLIFEGVPGDQPSFNRIENNMTDGDAFESGICSSCQMSGNRGGANPGWVSSNPTSWLDFRLAQGSPAIDAGMNLGTGNDKGLDPSSTSWPPGILSQNQSGAGWELGAFVFK